MVQPTDGDTDVIDPGSDGVNSGGANSGGVDSIGGDRSDPLPTTPADAAAVAVIMGDGFAAGEGAGDYAGPTPFGHFQTGWDVLAQPYYCHKSARNMLALADLAAVDPGISKRLNLACSGAGVAEGITSTQPSRAVKSSQLMQLRRAAESDRVRLIVLMTGLDEVYGGDRFARLEKCAKSFVWNGFTPGINPTDPFRQHNPLRRSARDRCGGRCHRQARRYGSPDQGRGWRA